MQNFVIKVRNLSKRYRIGYNDKNSDTLIHNISNAILSPFRNFKRLRDLSNFGEEDNSVFWALNDVSFEVKEGEVLGIIGRNGAGKSTLLKILSQITEPTSGKVEINGRVASLLEVGTGFHPELSGRENIYMNGTILGMTRKEIDSKLDEIIDFSGVEKFIDTPVKFYSSGMKVRLGFSVAAHLDPEILIIDEVLAVGDYEFQAKCLGKMEDVSRNEGRTVLFVSHDINSVKRLCQKTIILKNGQIDYLGSTSEAVDKYLFKDLENNFKWLGLDGNAEVKIFRTEIVSNSVNSFFIDSKIFIEIEIEFLKSYSNFVIGFNLISQFGAEIARANYNDFLDNKFIEKGRYIFRFKINEYSLAVGSYSVSFDIAIPYVSKINSRNIDLGFNLEARSSVGNIFNLSNSRSYNSQIRQDWFLEKIRIDEKE